MLIRKIRIIPQLLMADKVSKKRYCRGQSSSVFPELSNFNNWLCIKILARWAGFCTQVICLNALLLSNVYAMASEDDIFKPYVAAELLYDSNLFRLDKNLDPDNSIKGEFIKTINAGIEIDWKISQQQFLIKADINQNWFQTYEELNYFGWDVRGEWNWKIGSDWEGILAYSNSQTLGTYNQINRVIPNLNNFVTYEASAGYLFHPSGRIRLGFFRTENKYKAESRQISNLTENNAELNLELLSPSGSVVGIRVLATDGEYPNRQFTGSELLDQNFLRMDYAVTYNWIWSSKTRLYGRLGYTQQDYDVSSNRNFGDVTMQFNVSWLPTEKVTVLFTGWREIRPIEDILASFNLSQGLLINPRWELSPNIHMSTNLSFEQQDYQGVLGVDNERTDNIGKFLYNFVYQPFQNTTFDLLLGYEIKHSNRALRSYQSITTGLNMKFVF